LYVCRNLAVVLLLLLLSTRNCGCRPAALATTFHATHSHHQFVCHGSQFVDMQPARLSNCHNRLPSNTCVSPFSQVSYCICDVITPRHCEIMVIKHKTLGQPCRAKHKALGSFGHEASQSLALVHRFDKHPVCLGGLARAILGPGCGAILASVDASNLPSCVVPSLTVWSDDMNYSYPYHIAPPLFRLSSLSALCRMRLTIR